MTEPTGSLRAAFEAGWEARNTGYAGMQYGCAKAWEAFCAAQPAPPTEATEARAATQPDRDLVADILDEIGGYDLDSYQIRSGQGDHKNTVQIAISHRLHAPTQATPPHDGLREALKAVRADLLNENGLNGQSIACTIWHSSFETTVDFIDAALSPSEVQPAGLGYAEALRSAQHALDLIARPSSTTRGLKQLAREESARLDFAIRTLANGEQA